MFRVIATSDPSERFSELPDLQRVSLPVLKLSVLIGDIVNALDECDCDKARGMVHKLNDFAQQAVLDQIRELIGRRFNVHG